MNSHERWALLLVTMAVFLFFFVGAEGAFSMVLVGVAFAAFVLMLLAMAKARIHTPGGP